MVRETGANLQQGQQQGKQFAYTGAKRAVDTVFRHLSNLGLDKVATQLRQEAGEARDADTFTKNPEEAILAQDAKHLDKAKDIKKNNQLAAQKLEKALNDLSPVSFKFAFSVLMFRYPEVFDKYINASQQQQQQAAEADPHQAANKKDSIVAR